MATASARMIISLRGEITPATPRDGALGATLENGSGGARWTNGQASGMVDKVYRAEGTLAASATDAYDLLAAGALNDLLGAAVDLDELKALTIVCVTGSIKILAPGANFLPIFGAAGDYILLTAGQTIGFDFGAAGLSLGTSSKFSVVDTAGGAGSTYSLMFVGSN